MRLRSSHIVVVIGTAILAFIILVIVREKGREETGAGGRAVMTSTAEIVVEPESFTLGTISNEKITTVELTVTNRGASPLHVTKVFGWCACIIAKLEGGSTTLAPGASVKVPIDIDPFKFPGFELKKRLSVESNDPTRKVVNIMIHALIDPEFAIEPDYIEFGSVRKGETVEGTLTLRQVGEQPIEITELKLVRGAMPGMELSTEKRPQEEWAAPDKPEYVIKARILPDIPAGRLIAPFRIMTSVKRMKTGFPSSVLAKIDSFYTIEPAEHMLMIRAYPGEKDVASAVIESDKPLEIFNLASSAKGVDVTIQKGEKPNQFRIELDITPEAKPGRVSGNVTFEARSGEMTARDSLRVFGVIRSQVDSGGEAPSSG